MPLEKQVCSLEYAKRLKELGEKQESLFYYVKESESDDWFLVYSYGYDWSDYPCYSCYKYKIAAYTVGELGERLPDYTRELGNLTIEKCETDHMSMEKLPKGWWNVSYWIWKNAYSKSGDIYLEKEYKHLQQADTEANARAKMRIYLLENKLI